MAAKTPQKGPNGHLFPSCLCMHRKGLRKLLGLSHVFLKNYSYGLEDKGLLDTCHGWTWAKLAPESLVF